VHADVQPGDRITGFTPILPVDAATCALQVSENLALGLPEMFVREQLHVVANGPSARDYFAQKPAGRSLAVNGALGEFLRRGRLPTFWAACDGQEKVADFIPDDPPRGIRYLVCSRCHPRVFEKLKGRDVMIWHVKDEGAQGRLRIAQSCSVTMTAAWLFIRKGVTDFDFWGWDGCWIDGEHHAGAGEVSEDLVNINFGGEAIGDEIVGGRTFQTTRSWAAESVAAEQFFHLAEYLDLRVTIHSDGLMKITQDGVLKERSACSLS
jgi:hypothetical protein